MRGQRVRTVELQLLRQGPPHNQLLSPLTNYLALCGDHPNTTLNFPLEHQSLKVRLRALRYRDSEETRKIQLYETASMVGQMFADVPGLISELGHRDSAAESLVHLSIATTASELSLVPFELANSPPGFPGSGGSLSLQTEFPVCITRRSRKVRFDVLDWDVPPRILMIASNAGGSVPLEEHYTLLRKLIDPWVKRHPAESTNAELAAVREHLVLIKDANVRTIKQEVQNAIDRGKPYTHIHILAHGCELPNEHESHGVALHQPDGTGTDAVDGERLGQLLGGKIPDVRRRRRFDIDNRPLVVTLAVCDSSNEGFDVARPGSSVAFNIHEACIPLVIGSQFPLTKTGSVVLTDSIYRRLLEGCDPRICLWEARRELFSQSVDKLKSNSVGRHDWASIVAFAALPPDIERETKRLERTQWKRRVESRLGEGDDVIEAYLEQGDNSTELDQKLVDAIEEVRSEIAGFDHFVDQTPDGRELEELTGVSASANKRVAELCWLGNALQRRSQVEETDTSVEVPRPEWLDYMWKSYRRYLLYAQNDPSHAWAFVQSLFLKRFLSFHTRSSKRRPSNQDRHVVSPRDNSDESLKHDWYRPKYMSFDRDYSQESASQRIWNLSDKVELGLLRFLIFEEVYEDAVAPIGLKEYCNANTAIDNMLNWLHGMDSIGMASRDDRARFAVYSGRRQILRYRNFANMVLHEATSVLESEYNVKARHRRFKKAYDSRKEQEKSQLTGYELLAETYPDFAVLYETVEEHILDQMEQE